MRGGFFVVTRIIEIRLYRFCREEARIWGCAGGYAARTPPNSVTFPLITVEPEILKVVEIKVVVQTKRLEES